MIEEKLKSKSKNKKKEIAMNIKTRYEFPLKMRDNFSILKQKE